MSEEFTRIRRRLVALAFVDEFLPFLALFTLWFDDNGVTVAQLSVVFVMWAVAALVLEIPTGVLADRVDRRRLLAGSFVLRLVGVSVWLVWPSFTGLIVGGALWAIHDATASGVWEAMIHDQLEAIDAERRYGTLMARIGQFSHAGTAVAALVSVPLLAAGVGLVGLGWTTIALQTTTIVLVLRLPDTSWVVERSRAAAVADESALGVRAIVGLLRDRSVAALLSSAAVVGGLAIIDEYVPLLARARGTADGLIPLVFLVVWVGLIAGGELANRHIDVRPMRLAAFVAVGGGAALVGLVGDATWMLAGMGVAYAAVEMTWVVTDARLQARVPAHVRATIASVREAGAGIVAGVALAVIGFLSDGDDPTPGLLIVASVLVASAALVALVPGASRRLDPTETTGPVPQDRPVA